MLCAYLKLFNQYFEQQLNRCKYFNQLFVVKTKRVKCLKCIEVCLFTIGAGDVQSVCTNQDSVRVMLNVVQYLRTQNTPTQG